MTRHHVISTTGCDVFFKLVTHYRDNLGAHFDSMVVTYSDGGKPVLGAALRDATSGCEMHRRAGQAGECWCCGYDEQLEFVSQTGVPLAHADYRISVSNGETWTGTTDARGRTERITSKQEEKITAVEFFPPEDSFQCCASSASQVKPASVKVELQDMITTDTEVGTSVKKIKIDSKTRLLTQGEIDMAWMIFEDAVDYSKVKIHSRPYLWLFQPENIVMTPNGEMYFHESRSQEDFSITENKLRHLFIHEMVHVWQYQMGYLVKMRGAIRLGLDYNYKLSSKNKLADYNMEAQGDLLADYYALKYLKDPPTMRQEQYANDQALYEEVLSDFFVDRRSEKNLPGGNIERPPMVDIP